MYYKVRETIGDGRGAVLSRNREKYILMEAVHHDDVHIALDVSKLSSEEIQKIKGNMKGVIVMEEIIPAYKQKLPVAMNPFPTEVSAVCAHRLEVLPENINLKGMRFILCALYEY